MAEVRRSVEASASDLLAFLRAEMAEGRDISLTHADAAAVMSVIDAAEKLAFLKHPSVCELLLARNYGYEASKVLAVVEAVEAIGGARE